MNEKFNIAIQKAKEVIQQLKYEGKDMVNTDKVKEIVEKLTGIKIHVASLSFSEANINYAFGAMMRVDSNKKTKEAFIILNKDTDAIFRRFSFVHELGHLITDKYNFYENEKQYTISAHIKYDLSSLPDDKCTDEYLINEQIANVFALLVLMPKNDFFKKVKELDSINETANFFGITSEAVLSRMQLGE